MKTVSVNVYKFNELSKEAKEKALSKLSGINVDSAELWSECMAEGFKEKAKENGFDCTEVYYSGFWSQGDGAMFEYDCLDSQLKKEFIESLNLSPMRKEWLLNNVYISGNGKHRGHYYHEKCAAHSIYWWVDNGDLHYSRPFYKWIESFGSDFEDFVIEKYEYLCREFYNSLEREYEYQTSEEAVIETIEANEYNFTEDGELF